LFNRFLQKGSGLVAFGAIGLFIAPVLLAVADTLVKA
jgi:predicted PurR-regulated permease PerM